MRVTHSVMTGWDKIVSIEHLQIHAAVVVVVMKDVTTLLQTPLHETCSQSKTLVKGFPCVKGPGFHCREVMLVRGWLHQRSVLGTEFHRD